MAHALVRYLSELNKLYISLVDEERGVYFDQCFYQQDTFSAFLILFKLKFYNHWFMIWGVRWMVENLGSLVIITYYRVSQKSC